MKKVLIGAGGCLLLALLAGVWKVYDILHASEGLQTKFLAFICESEKMPAAYGMIETLAKRGRKYAASRAAKEDMGRVTDELVRELDAFGLTPDEKAELAGMGEYEEGFFIARLQQQAYDRCPARSGKGDGEKAGRFMVETASALSFMQQALKEAQGE